MSVEGTIAKIEKLVEKGHSDKIAKYLGNKDVEVYKAAVEGLGKLQDETSVNLLSKLIDDPNPEIRKVAIVAFAKGGTQYAKTFLQHMLTKEKDTGVLEVLKQAVYNYTLTD